MEMGLGSGGRPQRRPHSCAQTAKAEVTRGSQKEGFEAWRASERTLCGLLCGRRAGAPVLAGGTWARAGGRARELTWMPP